MEAGDGGREEEKSVVARSSAEENATHDTWLAQGAATSVLDEDPGAPRCVRARVHVRGRRRQAPCCREPARPPASLVKRCPQQQPLTVG